LTTRILAALLIIALAAPGLAPLRVRAAGAFIPDVEINVSGALELTFESCLDTVVMFEGEDYPVFFFEDGTDVGQYMLKSVTIADMDRYGRFYALPESPDIFLCGIYSDEALEDMLDRPGAYAVPLREYLEGIDIPAEPSVTIDDFLPVTLITYEDEYTVTSYEAGYDENGYTAVTLYGIGFEIVSIVGSAFEFGATCVITAGDEVYTPTSGVYKDEEYMFSFNTTAAPDTITIINPETGEEVIAIDHKSLAEPDAAAPEDDFPDEYAGRWEGSEEGIDLSFIVYPNGTGEYVFVQGEYYESYPITLSAGEGTFEADIPGDNALGIVKCGGTFAFEGEAAALDITTEFESGSLFEYSITCQRTQPDTEPIMWFVISVEGIEYPLKTYDKSENDNGGLVVTINGENLNRKPEGFEFMDLWMGYITDGGADYYSIDESIGEDTISFTFEEMHEDVVFRLVHVPTGEVEMTYWVGTRPLEDVVSPYALPYVEAAIADEVITPLSDSGYTLPIMRNTLALALFNFIAMYNSYDFVEAIPQELMDAIPGDDATEEEALNWIYDSLDAAGIMEATEDGYDYAGLVTREQAAVIFDNFALFFGYESEPDAFEYDDDADISSWAKDSVYRVRALDIMGSGSDSFIPGDYLTVEQAVTCIYKAGGVEAETTEE
ncbi:MAG: hypothetical protein LBS19_07585, partial [Clostridiales bacterium]|nr:hypothetical protein [Clostridiales bacterium]